MGRRQYRRRSYRREQKPMTWQSFARTGNYSVPSNQNVRFFLGTTFPGIDKENGNNVPFDAPHVLERIRGTVTHAGQLANGVFTLDLAAMRLPKAAADLLDEQTDATKLPDPTMNSEGDDYLFYHSLICGTVVDRNTHEVDNKAKRKFDVGDALVWIMRANNSRSQNGALQFGLNVRLLWKLG